MSRDIGDQTGSLYFSYTFPVYQTRQADGSTSTIALSALSMGVIFFLESLFAEAPPGRGKRSIQEDQMELFHQIEDNISAMGVDGHACILRFICEMQTNRFSASSIFGEIFTLMFTPKQGDDYTLLKEYIEAEMAGAEGSQRCSERYLTCPVSVFSALRSLSGDLIGGFSTPQDKPLNSTSLSSGVSYLQDSLPWMENHL
ncbi:uncharacterized protein LOC119597842 isoform X2 [Penaeus monodon]|uniref:uncharacterized protein LOC119597842 isoform X2 n=1 Tax=Penaeus monodon TaxID=6687 RepID=UPI0018A74A76|nr:uncharacterized protein LOC119597842 isoform X2 [Penaeus monodon]